MDLAQPCWERRYWKTGNPPDKPPQSPFLITGDHQAKKAPAYSRQQRHREREMRAHDPITKLKSLLHHLFIIDADSLSWDNSPPALGEF